MRVHPDSRNIAVRSGETLLEAGLGAGIGLPFECRNGGCGKCMCTLLHGSVDYGAYQASALIEADKALGKAHRYGALLLAALGLQLSLGAALVLTDFPLLLAMLHNLGAVMLLGATVSLLGRNSRRKEES